MSPAERWLLRVLAENQSVILNALSEMNPDGESARLLHSMASLTIDEIKLFDAETSGGESTGRPN